MDRIKKVMVNAYKEGNFPEERKSIVLKEIQKRKRIIHPIPLVSILFIAVLFLLISTMIQPTEQLEYASNVNVGTNLEDVYMERILKGFTISTEAELEQYLSESDWLLQRALESANIVSSPDLDQWERHDLAALLHYLYIWRENFKTKTLPFDTVTTFHEITREAPFYIKVLSDFFENEKYMTSLEEKENIPITYFDSMTKTNQIGLICVIIFFILLFIWNTKKREKLHFKLIPIAFILICVIPLVSPVENDYAYDETSLIQVAQAKLKFQGGVLENAATFDDARYGLISVNDMHHMVTFLKDEHGYSFARSSGDSGWVHFDSKMGNKEGESVMIAGFFEGHPYSKVELVGDNGHVVAFHANPGESDIKKVVLPSSSYRHYYYDEEGNEIK